ncbi:MAG: hypothetical protein LBV58_02235 [Acholeplasmatales bacterium]|nr:hypothetical protein [Acholeplasmatales bacterium]
METMENEKGTWEKIEALIEIGINPMNRKMQMVRIDAWRLIKEKEPPTKE